MNKALTSIIILIFILGAGIAFFQNVLVKPEVPGAGVTTGGTSNSPAAENPTSTTTAPFTDGTPSTSAGPCYVGGCSGQICSDEEGAISTCEYREAYACFKTAKCERQASGQCGWTQTSALSMCLKAAE